MTTPDPDLTTVEITVNGEKARVAVPLDTTLLQLLREDLGLTAAKLGCGSGQCGACTVELDGLPLTACIQVAAQAQGSTVRTLEGLAADHPLPAALVAHGGVQCGFCIPGIVMAAVASLETRRDLSEAEVREALIGNLCRCTGYQTIVEGVRAWSRRGPKAS